MSTSTHTTPEPTLGAAENGAAAEPVTVTQNGGSWRLVALREIQVKLTDRNFLFSTALSLLLVVGMLAFQGYMATRSAHYTVGVSDEAASKVVAAAQTELQADGSEATITTVPITGTDLTAALEKSGADALLTGHDGAWTLTTDGSPATALQTALAGVVRTDALTANASAAGTSLDQLSAGTELALNDVSGADADRAGVAAVAGFIFAFLFYLSSLMFGMSIATSVVEEKQSRIVEILAAKIPVQRLLTGKVVGNAALAFGQLLLLVAVGLIGVSFTPFRSYLPMLSGAVAWYVPFFVVGFLALACIWAAAGAMCSRNEDLQSTTMPISMTLIVAIFAGIGLDGTPRVIGSFVPILSTIVMPGRIVDGSAAWWEPVLSLLITIAFCALTVRFGATIYRRALLQTQGRVGFKQALSLSD